MAQMIAVSFVQSHGRSAPLVARRPGRGRTPGTAKMDVVARMLGTGPVVGVRLR